MSQTRPTVVHRFVMRDTIEESIHKLRTQESHIGGGAAVDDDARHSSSNEASVVSPRRSVTGASGSPNKKQRRVAEESKFLSWETVQALGLESIDLAPPVSE